MKRLKLLVVVICVLLNIATAVFAQEPKATKQEATQPDPHLLTDNEQRELAQALNFAGQAKKEYDLALEDALNVPIERMNALEVVGRLQKANTILKAANQHIIDLRETHRARRSDCGKCEYAPDLKSLVRPPAEGGRNPS